MEIPYGCVRAKRSTRPLKRADEIRFHYSREADPDPDCVPAKETKEICLEWELPLEPPEDAEVDDWNELETDVLEFDMSFYTEQCRHNDDPIDPWEDDD